jgi:hypothetical protein
MYYIFASLVVGAFIGGSALMGNVAPTSNPAESSYTQESYAQVEDASPIIDNEALSADAVLSLSL